MASLKQIPEEEEIDSFQELMADLSKAQADMTSAQNLNAVRAHIRDVQYPLIARSIALQVHLRETFKEMAEELEQRPENLSDESADFIEGVLDSLENFIRKYAPYARDAAEKGDPAFRDELAALHRGAQGIREIVQVAVNDGAIIEEIEDVE